MSAIGLSARLSKRAVITAAVLITCALTVRGQQATAPLSAPALQSLVAGVALYPDAVIEQALTAAQEPISLHQGAQQLSNAAASEADQALQASLPESVRYLQQYAQLLQQLDAGLPQTIQLGVAAKNQLQDVWNAIDAVRAQSTQPAAAADETATEPAEATATTTSSVGIYGVPVRAAGPGWLAPLTVNEAREAHVRHTAVDAAAPFGRNAAVGAVGSAQVGRPVNPVPVTNFQRGVPGAQRPGLNDPGLNDPGLNNPGRFGNPGVNDPGINNPGLDNRGSNNSGLNNAGPNNRGAGPNHAGASPNNAGLNNPGTRGPQTRSGSGGARPSPGGRSRGRR